MPHTFPEQKTKASGAASGQKRTRKPSAKVAANLAPDAAAPAKTVKPLSMLQKMLQRPVEKKSGKGKGRLMPAPKPAQGSGMQLCTNPRCVEILSEQDRAKHRRFNKSMGEPHLSSRLCFLRLFFMGCCNMCNDVAC